MEYPKEILPHSEYKTIDCELTGKSLLRLTNTNKIEEIIDQETGKISIQQICSPKERIDDFSLSLFGVYNTDHINLEFTKEGKQKYMHYCAPDELVEIPIFEVDFYNNAEKLCWFAEVTRFHNIEFQFTMGEDPFTATCIVVHTPMKWNYWHFSLRWLTDAGPLENMEDSQRKKVARRIGHSVRTLISQFATLNLPSATYLPQNCYWKN
jgi:hypothetical protein